MNLKLPVATTEELNELNLQPGIVVVDKGRSAIRVYDGTTPGGFEIQGVRAFIPPYTGAGEQKPIAGNFHLGYFGNVPNDQLITPGDLADRVGFTVGTDVNQNYPWIKFGYKGKFLFVAQRPFKHSISWDQLDTLDLVYGNRQILIGSDMYKVRLIEGTNVEPGATSDIEGSEWNDLMYRVSSTNTGLDNWSSMSNSVLGLSLSTGSRTLTQNTLVTNDGSAIHRGLNAITAVGSIAKSSVHSNNGWRPVLELIPAESIVFQAYGQGHVVNVDLVPLASFVHTPETGLQMQRFVSHITNDLLTVTSLKQDVDAGLKMQRFTGHQTTDILPLHTITFSTGE